MLPAAVFPQPKEPDAAPSLGSILTLPRPELLEVAALAGCEWVLVDCEHGSVGNADLSALLAGAPPDLRVLVRVAAAEETHVKQALDAGADGIVCPAVPDAATADALVRWAKYPPQGRRSVGVGRAHGYGLGFPEYVAGANERTSVVVQIETTRGVAAADEILAVDGLGGVLIGPYDLSASMGFMGRPDAPEVTAVVADVARRARGRGLPVGLFYVTSAAFAAAVDRPPLDFVLVGTDTALLAGALRSELAQVAAL